MTPGIDPSVFPTTRYQGSKRKLIPQLSQAFEQAHFKSALDLYSGTGTVSLLMRTLGFSVHANDLLLFNQNSARLLLGATTPFLMSRKHDATLRALLYEEPTKSRELVSKKFSGIFFPEEENHEIDRFCQNVADCDDLDRALYVYCVGQALMMKRPYNLFHRANLSMRTRDVVRSFGNHKTWSTSTLSHAQKILLQLRRFPFPESSATHRSTCIDADEVSEFHDDYDLVYLDPPYLSAAGVGVDYCDFYHFLEGLVDYDLFELGDEKYPHRPIVKARSAWLSVVGAEQQLQKVVQRFSCATIVLSYRIDGLPSVTSLAETFAAAGRELVERTVEPYKYALSKSSDSGELLLISPPTKKV